jgi:predicted Fe-Mo cluster-binding NifX family protein
MVDPRFGRCEAFALIDTETGAIRFLDNAAKAASGGAGIAAAQQLLDAGVNAVCTGNLGPNAFRVLSEGEIKAYRVGEMPLMDAVNQLKEGKLEEISRAGQAHAGMHRGTNG